MQAWVRVSRSGLFEELTSEADKAIRDRLKRAEKVVVQYQEEAKKQGDSNSKKQHSLEAYNAFCQVSLDFRGVIEIGYCSTLVVLCFIWGSALDSSDLLVSYHVITLSIIITHYPLSSHIITILIFTPSSKHSSIPLSPPCDRPSRPS